jgi:GxxExxY protein
MDTNKHECAALEAKLVFRIIGCALEVLNSLGHGLHEKPYENALAIELALRGLPFDKQSRYPVTYKGHVVSEFVPDLVVQHAVVVDAKVIDRITDQERGQMLNYLRITGHRSRTAHQLQAPKARVGAPRALIAFVFIRVHSWLTPFLSPQ